MSRYLLWGFFGFNNLGDELLLESTVSEINKVDKSASFIVKGGVSKSEQLKLNENDFVDFDAVFSSNKSQVVKLIFFIKTLISIRHQYDILVFSGGTTFHYNKNLSNAFILFFLCFFSKVMKKKIYAIGIGFNKGESLLGRILFYFIFKFHTAIYARDNTTFNNILSICSHDQLSQSADLVLGSSVFDTAFKKNHARDSNIKHVGITIPASDDVFNNVEFRKKFARELSHLIDSLINDGIEVHFYSFQEYSRSNISLSDKELFCQLLDYNVENVIFHYCSGRNFESVAEKMSVCDFIIGMRFHSLVIAISQKIPFVGLSNDHKVLDISNMLGMPYYRLDEVSNVLSDIKSSTFKFHYNANCVSKLISKAKRNFDFIKGSI